MIEKKNATTDDTKKHITPPTPACNGKKRIPAPIPVPTKLIVQVN